MEINVGWVETESKPLDLEVFDFKRYNPNLKVWTPRLNLMAVIRRLLNTWCLVGFHFVPFEAIRGLSFFDKKT
jgi:hypothetical protein